jgi:hypothetical protein
MRHHGNGKIRCPERRLLRAPEIHESRRADREGDLAALRDLYTVVDTPRRAGASVARSEERRVGKECRRLCRSRWSPYH